MVNGNVIIKLLSLWVLDSEYETDTIDKNFISHGIWQACGVELKESTDINGKVTTSRAYTMVCVAPARSDLKIGESRVMHENAILYLCHPVEIKHLSKLI
jgi:hypothetical protein